MSEFYRSQISVLYLVCVIFSLWVWAVCVLSGSLKVNWHWMWGTSGRLSCDLKCTACITVVTASEQNREERRHLSVHGLHVRACSDRMWVWLNWCVCVCVRARMNTAGRPQLWQDSAAEGDKCCHGQVAPNRSRSDLLSSSFHSRSSSTSSASDSPSHSEVQLATVLDWAWKHTSVQWPLRYSCHRHEECVYSSLNSC